MDVFVYVIESSLAGCFDNKMTVTWHIIDIFVMFNWKTTFGIGWENSGLC